MDIKKKFEGIAVGIDIPDAVVIAEQTADDKEDLKKKFEGITVGIDVPDAVAVDEKIYKAAFQRRFAGTAVAIKLPDTVKIDDKQFEVEHLDIDLPQITKIDMTDILTTAESEGLSIRRA